MGRASTGGPLDDIILQQGRWATRPGEIVIDPTTGQSRMRTIGGTVTVTSAPGKPKLTVVGFAVSITDDQEAWVVPSQVAALRPKGAPAQEQMLYTFTSAATAQQVSADLGGAEARAARRGGHQLGVLAGLRRARAPGAGLNTPFAVAFAIIGLVLAVLITANVVSAAVVGRVPADRRAQEHRLHPGPGRRRLPGPDRHAGAGRGHRRHGAGQLVGAADAERRGRSTAVAVPLWINITVPLGMLALTGLAALVPALRAGRLSAVAAIAAGQAPRAGHGYAAHRLAGKLALPRPVTIGPGRPVHPPRPLGRHPGRGHVRADRGGAGDRPGLLARQDQRSRHPAAADRAGLSPARRQAAGHSPPASSRRSPPRCAPSPGR